MGEATKHKNQKLGVKKTCCMSSAPQGNHKIPMDLIHWFVFSSKHLFEKEKLNIGMFHLADCIATDKSISNFGCPKLPASDMLQWEKTMHRWQFHTK